jgi:hypothetical protein
MQRGEKRRGKESPVHIADRQGQVVVETRQFDAPLASDHPCRLVGYVEPLGRFAENWLALRRAFGARQVLGARRVGQVVAQAAKEVNNVLHARPLHVDDCQGQVVIEP